MDDPVITGPEGVEIHSTGLYWHVDRPCVDHGMDGCGEYGCPSPNGLDLDLDGLYEEDPHLASMITYIVDQAHEALEWIKMDGERFADPHPSGADEMGWNILIHHAREMMTEYRKAFPA